MFEPTRIPLTQLHLPNTVTNAGYVLKGKYLEFIAGHEALLQETLAPPGTVPPASTRSRSSKVVSVNQARSENSANNAAPRDETYVDPITGKTKAAPPPMDKRPAPPQPRLPPTVAPIQSLMDVLMSLGKVFTMPEFSTIHMGSVRPLVMFMRALPRDTLTHVARAWPFPIFPMCHLDLDRSKPFILNPNVNSIFVVHPSVPWSGKAWPVADIRHVNIIRWAAPSTMSLGALQAYPNLHLLIIDCSGWASSEFGEFADAVSSVPELSILRLHSIPAFDNISRPIARMCSALELKELVVRFRERPTFSQSVRCSPSIVCSSLKRLMLENSSMKLSSLFSDSLPNLEYLAMVRCIIIGVASPIAVRRLKSFTLVDCSRQTVTDTVVGKVLTVAVTANYYLMLERDASGEWAAPFSQASEAAKYGMSAVSRPGQTFLDGPRLGAGGGGGCEFGEDLDLNWMDPSGLFR